jgi:hypothetical protein
MRARWAGRMGGKCIPVASVAALNTCNYLFWWFVGWEDLKGRGTQQIN